MATLLLAAAGSALAGAFGGSLGVAAATAAQVGGALGAVGGAVIDEALPRALTPSRTQAPLNQIAISSASEGVGVKKLWGRMRLGGNVIWSTRFKQTSGATAPGGGKGSLFGGAPTQSAPTYALSFAVAFCEGGTAVSLGRLWADGNELDQSKYTIRFYNGAETQAPDSLIQSTEGAANVPAYRGICYAVFDTMDLTDFGNRMPQITAEIIRYPDTPDADDLRNCLHSVAMLPGSGEFVYGTTAYTSVTSFSHSASENVHTTLGVTDLQASLNLLQGGAYATDKHHSGSGWMPSADLGALCAPSAVMLIVTWFGTDLRAGSCRIVPKVETRAKTVIPSDWSVNGISRSAAEVVSQTTATGGARPVFGGTPSDATVTQAIAELKARGLRIVFYPFVLMDISAGNGLPDPYGGTEQAAFPWRGRITCTPAPCRPGTVDKTGTAATQVAAFFAQYNPMVAHYAGLCAAAGGVDAFVIGSEFVGLTSVRSSPGDGIYPAVQAFVSLAASVKTIVGSACKVGYAADWSEFHSHRPNDGTGDVIFNMDPLWASPNIDFVGIDHYLPLSDWRDTLPNVDADPVHGPFAPHDKIYLAGNVEGGEYYAYYYASQADRVAQTRTTITDLAYGEPWVFRQKDIRNWWLNSHRSRPGGVRNASVTAWTAQGKPVWFTELGCPAVDKGSNQPNVFYDPKSSESAFPYFSRGSKDDAIQRAYLETVLRYWRDHAPVSAVYSGAMIDPINIIAWAWDARPFPDFPAKDTVWGDSANWEYGHWLTGRLSFVPLKWIVAEYAAAVGLLPTDIDTSGLLGATTLVPGTVADGIVSPRDALASLMNAFQFDVAESLGVLRFQSKALTRMTAVDSGLFVLGSDTDVGFSVTRAQETDLAGSVSLSFIDVYNAYNTATVDARKAVGNSQNVSAVTTGSVLDQGQAKTLAESILQQVWTARESGTVALPPSLLALDPGDGLLLAVDGVTIAARIKEIDTSTCRTASFVGFDPTLATGPIYPPSAKRTPATDAFGTSAVEFVEMPLLTGTEEQPWAPRIAAFQDPWPLGGVAVYRANGTGYDYVTTAATPAVMGELTAPFSSGPLDRWDLGNSLQVQFYGAASLASRIDAAVFAGNNALIVKNPSGDWEVVQFANAAATGTNAYTLTRLLRGQLGTEGAMGNPVPAGARVIALDATRFAILAMNVDQRGIAQTLSYGPAVNDQADPTYQTTTITVRGVGLRPYSVADIRGSRARPGSDVTFTWKRRTRFGGDNFDLATVPLNEDIEAYDVEVVGSGGAVVRSITVNAPTWLYDTASQTADFGAPQPAYTINIYQDSVLYGRGQVRTARVFL